MHNLHIVVVEATSPENACSTVEDAIMDWGDENNWKTVCGCISNKGEIYNKENGRFSPKDSDIASIEDLNAMCGRWVNAAPYIPEEYKLELIACLNGEKEINNPLLWYTLKKMADHYYNKSLFAVSKENKGGGDFDVFTDEYRAYQYDECGITNLDYLNTGDNSAKKYAVFIDVHS